MQRVSWDIYNFGDIRDPIQNQLRSWWIQDEVEYGQSGWNRWVPIKLYSCDDCSLEGTCEREERWM